MDISREMWVVKGRDPVLWTIPFYVAWKEIDLCEMVSAVPLLTRHRSAVDRVLFLAGKERNGRWYLKREALRNIASQVTPTDPENHFSWSKPAPLREDGKTIDKTSNFRDEFLDALHLAGVGKDRNEVEYWWSQFCNHAADWLINREKPVDMFWFMLHPSPYRANWKHLLLQKYPRLGIQLCHLSKSDRDTLLHNSRILEEMLSCDLLAMHKGRTCYRTVDVELKPAWWKMVLRVERARLRRLTDSGYAKNFFDSIKRRLPVSIRLYIEYLVQVARPTAVDVECGKGGVFRIMPHRPQILPSLNTPSEPVAAVVPNSLPVAVAASPSLRLYPEAYKLLQMSHLRSVSKNVREGRKHDTGNKPT